MMRRTKIICTLGPASESREMMQKLILAGMNVARFNFSHGTHQEHEEKFRRLRDLRVAMNMPIATLLDTKGPEIRLRDFKDGGVELEKGSTFTLTTDDVLGDSTRASISYAGLPEDVERGMEILIDDGLIALMVEDVTETEIRCTVKNGGRVSDKKGINVPAANLSMPFVSEQDRDDIVLGCRLGFDMIACSFTRSAQDILDVRKILDEYGSKMKVIAKIENPQGIKNIDEILNVADGVMVARGDMAVEIPLEDVPVIQKQIIKKAFDKNRVVITATQMLESMIHNPRPTRAEATDVANAIYDGTTAIMLSGETAAGEYPVEAVRTMSRIARRTEQDINYSARRERSYHNGTLESDKTMAIAYAAAAIAENIGARAIISVTMSGMTAQRVSHYRPSCPIIACTVNARVACQTNILFGTVPLIIGIERDADTLFSKAIKCAVRAGLVSIGDTVLLTAGVPLGESGNTNMIKVIEVEDQED